MKATIKGVSKTGSGYSLEIAIDLPLHDASLSGKREKSEERDDFGNAKDILGSSPAEKFAAAQLALGLALESHKGGQIEFSLITAAPPEPAPEAPIEPAPADPAPPNPS